MGSKRALWTLVLALAATATPARAADNTTPQQPQPQAPAQQPAPPQTIQAKPGTTIIIPGGGGGGVVVVPRPGQPNRSDTIRPADPKKFQRLVTLLMAPQTMLNYLEHYGSTTGGGGGGGQTPGIITTSISSVVGKDPLGTSTIDRLVERDHMQLNELRTAIGNNPALVAALDRAHVELDNVMAVDMLPSGGIEVFTR